MDKYDELLAKADAIAEELKYNNIVLNDALERAKALQMDLLLNEIEDFLNEES
jgi:hypothetical protein